VSGCRRDRELSGFGCSQFIEHWLSWLISWLAMLPAVLLAAPLIRALVDHFTRE
jgi:hypothetical protein